jgi:putative aldouronate transport system permease protein
MQKRSFGERIFQVALIGFFILFCFITVYPFINAIAYSFSSAIEVSRNTITVYPIGFTLDNYRLVFARNDIWNSALISAGRTVVGTVIMVTFTGIAAYAVSIRTLPFKRFIVIFLLIPLYLDPGIIPQYVLIYDLHLLNNFWVYILPLAFAVYWMIIMRSYYDTLPVSLSESARIDGASELLIFVRIILPLSAPIVATVALFQGVFHWNRWFDAMLYVTHPDLFPLQFLLRLILIENQITDASSAMVASRSIQQFSPESLKMATLIITTAPVLLVYPFFQRYFVKGMMIGAVKG